LAYGIILKKNVISLFSYQRPMAAVEQAQKASEEELETINTLPAALLRRAFEGEL
jgi:hypothetical protein